jgi:membrane fusion protein, multidrug efflux system
MVIAVVLLGVICGGLVGFNLFRQQAIEEFFATMQPPAITVSAAEVSVVTWQPVIEAFGTVGASQGVDIAAQTAGVVDQILFAANDRIRKGQLLVQVDDAVEQADLIAARAAVERDRQALERVKTLSERGVSSSATLETAQSDLAASTSQLERLKAVLEQKAIEAPFAGIIGIPRVEVGQYVTAGAAIATLQNLDKMRVDFTVREQDLARIGIGQPVRSGTAADELVFQGQITGIEPKIDPATRLVSVRAEIANADGELRPGQFARVEVVLAEEDGIMAVPQTAVVSSLYGDFVYVVSPQPDAERKEGGEQPLTSSVAGQAQAREEAQDKDPQDQEAADEEPPLIARQVFVQTGRSSGGIIEIIDGLEVGQQVVTAGQNKLSSGARVVIDNSVEPSRRPKDAQGDGRENDARGDRK